MIKKQTLKRINWLLSTLDPPYPETFRYSTELTTFRIIWDHLRAPFILFPVLWRLPREADDLPEKWAYWRNNVSINGDGWAYWDPSEATWKHCSHGSEPPGSQVVRYSDPLYTGDAYYAPGHHPRSFYARWIWLAFRNVASQRAKDIGPLITSPPQILLELWNSQTKKYEKILTYKDLYFQYKSSRKWWIFELWTNVGYKLDTALTSAVYPTKVMITNTWIAIRKWHLS